MSPFETPRLGLRELTVKDAAFILELLNDPSFISNIGDRQVRTLNQAQTYIQEKFMSSYQQHDFGLYLVEIKSTHEPIGISGLVKRETLKDVDIGFAFLPKFHKQGYALESAKEVMVYARQTLKLNRIVGITIKENKSSIKVLEGLGMKFEKMVKISNGADSKEVMLFGLQF